jgi:hypothetical protein
MADGHSTLDLFGNGFHLLRFGDADVSALEQAFDAREVPLEITSMSNPEIAALYEKPLVLVRPDGHVAWRGDAPPAEPDRLVDHVRGIA